MHGDDLRGLAGGEMDRLIDADDAAITRNELISVTCREHGCPIEEHASKLGHCEPFPEVQPDAGRSNHTCT